MDVRAAIEIVIGNVHTHVLAAEAADAPFIGGIFECAVAAIQKALIGPAFIEFGAAIILGV